MPFVIRACRLFASVVLVCACSGGDQGTDDAAGGAGGAAPGGFGGQGPLGDISGEVRRYDYAFDLSSAAALARLSVAVAPPGGDCYSVACLLPPSEVTFAGTPAASFALAADTLQACGESIEPGGELALCASVAVPEETAFFGLDVGFSHKKNLVGGTFSYLLSWLGGCSRFGPCDHDPARLVELHFAVTHPPGTTVLCGGTLTAGAELTRCDLSMPLAPTYSGFALAADADWARQPFATAGGVELVFYEVPGGELASSLDPARVVAAVEWLTGLLGPYPYGSELRFAGAPTAWLGFEHPGNVLLYDELPKQTGAYADGTMHVLVHETVHQWAGNRTTLASTADFVWKEAIAEYLTYVIEDEQGNPGEADDSRAYWDKAAVQAKHFPRPTDDPTPPITAFYGDVYGAGPMVLFVQLEPIVGRAALLAAIASFLATPGARSVAELREAIEQASGQDLGAYFSAWAFGAGKPAWPVLAATVDQVEDEVTVTLTQQGPKPFGFVVEVDVVGTSQQATALVDFGPAPSSASASAVVTLAEPVVEVVVDPRHRVIDLSAKAVASDPATDVWIF
jgi:aminopeptidase N